MSSSARFPWLFSATTDLSVFLGSALLSFALLAVGAQLGILHSDSPEWLWVPAVLLIDVAHVWSTIFRVYLDTDERKRRALLYGGIPLLAYAGGVVAYSFGALWFWRAAAYLAVYHFIRQQYGWVALYRRRGQESGELDRILDKLTIYAVTLYPLLYWHAHLPQRYWWFVPHDFVQALPIWVAGVAAPLYWLIVAAYLARGLYRYSVLGMRNPGKDIVVVTTALCWYLGIVTFNSDYAFTVTNVIIHGVPYFALVYYYGRKRVSAGHGGGIRILAYGPWLFLAVLVVLAYGEELLWDRLVWHDRPWLFGGGWSWGRAAESFLVPLLALPQLTHYLLDGFIWRRRSNPELGVSLQRL
jgi:hypothetical protein